MNPLKRLQQFGQAIWLDYIRRSLVTGGELDRLIEEDGLAGVTSNPSIFEKAIDGSRDYDNAIRALALEGHSAEEIYRNLSVGDVQGAADLFRPLYNRTNGRDGFVSLEVSPHLAHSTKETIAEARQLWQELERPNVFIKVPGTEEGLPAIRQLIGEGINVNVTLLFGLPRYRKVAEAYIEGLEELERQGKPMEHVASVASFFLSRIDVLVDPMLEKRADRGGQEGEAANSLRGQVAIASAKSAYQIYKEIFNGERFRKLASRGARSQRLLWASTSTKNPAYSDVKYVDALIGPMTVNTVPLETLNAYRDHGHPAPRLEENHADADGVLKDLARVGIDIDEVTHQLEDEGVEKFVKPYDRLMETLKKQRADVLEEQVDLQRLELGDFGSAVQKRLQVLEKEQFGPRLWRKDPSLWKSDPKDHKVITNALGWLHVAEKMEENLRNLSDFLDEVRGAGFRRVVHMGMGGSSLAPLSFMRTFPRPKNGLPLSVLDTTDPATILNVEQGAPLEHSLFIVASKSGTTAEPLAFDEYFYTKVNGLKGDQAGENFVAITDPGTPLVDRARERGYRRTFLNYADIGGRYSALSFFGLVPAALMGVDVNDLLGRALRMEHACASCVPVAESPGVVLGAAMGELALQGRNKVTFLVPEPISTLGMWLEQLLAESTGKEGTGLLPVAGEAIGDPSVYSDDRLFIYYTLKGRADERLDRTVAALRKAHHPVITIQMEDLMDLGQEFFRWEIATATAGAILGINAFDQPNVQESKDNTNRLLEVVRKKGELPEEKPTLVEGPLRLYAEKTGRTAAETLAQYIGQAHPGDYVALMAYLTEDSSTEQALHDIGKRLRDSLHVPTTLGYGPRYLHSTGQFHKGGPNTGLFFQLTADEEHDVPVPGQPYTFGVFKRAQALGDLEALRKHRRRVLRVHLGADVGGGLAALSKAIDAAVANRPA